MRFVGALLLSALVGGCFSWGDPDRSKDMGSGLPADTGDATGTEVGSGRSDQSDGSDSSYPTRASYLNGSPMKEGSNQK